MWNTIKEEFLNFDFGNEFEESFIRECILSVDSLHDSLVIVLANKIATPKFTFDQFRKLFLDAYEDSEFLKTALKQDLQAILDRDFACNKLSEPLLFYNGFHGLQLQRLAHYFYTNKSFVSSFLIHERMVSRCSMDIHPAVPIGIGAVIDHGIGVVIGETARIGNNVFMYHNVTLGSNGTKGGVRHPVIEDNVLLGSTSSILGNITVGKGSAIAAGSVVTKSVPPNTLVAGNPAKEIGPAKEFQKKDQ